MQIFKSEIVAMLLTIINEKIIISKNAIDSAKETRDSDTKSSAGDKYETTREMMQIEIDKNTAQLSNAIRLKEELYKIDINKKFTKAQFGSLLKTNKGFYFLSIGIGKIAVNAKSVYVISTDSPIGKQILNKQIGDKIQFQGNEIAIEDII